MTYEEYRAKHWQIYNSITFDDLRKDTPETQEKLKSFWRFQSQHAEHHKRLLLEDGVI